MAFGKCSRAVPLRSNTDLAEADVFPECTGTQTWYCNAGSGQFVILRSVHLEAVEVPEQTDTASALKPRSDIWGLAHSSNQNHSRRLTLGNLFSLVYTVL